MNKFTRIDYFFKVDNNNDILLGGADHDTAWGGLGNDTYEAEVRIKCEQ